jgi:hypothetical protein
VIEHPIDSNRFRGELKIFHPGGDPEIRGLEGVMNPSEEMISFIDSAGWAYWGWYREIALGGELSLECMHCEVRGAFEFHRP